VAAKFLEDSSDGADNAMVAVSGRYTGVGTSGHSKKLRKEIGYSNDTINIGQGGWIGTSTRGNKSASNGVLEQSNTYSPVKVHV
jgi:hypothetical protein